MALARWQTTTWLMNKPQCGACENLRSLHFWDKTQARHLSCFFCRSRFISLSGASPLLFLSSVFHWCQCQYFHSTPIFTDYLQMMTCLTLKILAHCSCHLANVDVYSGDLSEMAIDFKMARKASRHPRRCAFVAIDLIIVIFHNARTFHCSAGTIKCLGSTLMEFN